jgi:glycosyltransferase involved in cell wall biosynthesis
MSKSSPIRVLELRSVRGTGGGPEKTILLGAARTDPRQFAVTVCYIRDRRDDVFSLDHLARKLGVDYVQIFERHSFDRRIWPALRQLVRDRGIDIVHAHEYKTDVLALLLARAEGVAPLATAHGWTGHSPRETKIYYPADRFVLRRFPRVISVSGEIRDCLINSGADPAKVTTVLNGIDPALFKHHEGRAEQMRASFGFSADDIVIGSVGRLERQKRFDLLIETLARLRRAGLNVKLVIAGDGSLRSALTEAAEAWGVTDACVFAGHRPDVSDILHAFDVFVQSSDYEGTPNSVLEAMAVETPVVATTAGGTGELAHHGVHGLLVSPGDTVGLADAIRRTVDEPGQTAHRVAAARRRVEGELSFETRMRTVEQIYQELVGGRVLASDAAAVA